MEGNTGGKGPPGGGGAPVVRRLRTLKRRKEEKESNKNQVKLERVLGLTVTSNASLATAPSTGLVAYPAGCTVVLFNPRKNKQQHIGNPGKKTITAVGWSEDGRYLVTGECGHLPSVRVWDNQEKQCVGEFQGHKYGINCVAFAPNNKYLVSVGSQHDMIVNVWDWKNNIKVASNKVSTKVKAISFAENGSYFVTAGNRHVKFWYLEYSRSAKYKEPVPLMGRSAILGEQRNNYFCDVACGRGEMGDSTYAITKSGLLCEFNNRRLLDKWVELRTTSANCLSVGEELIFIGCADGIVRCFSPHTLQFVTTLPRTHYLGVDVAKGLTISHMASHPQEAQYPDAVAVSYDEKNGRVSVVYNDHSLYIWDVRDVRKVGKSHSFLGHSACIWGLEVYPSSQGDGKKPVLPPGSFVTCGSDDTIRIWNIDNAMPSNTLYRRNIYSEELLKTIYIDEELAFIKEADNSLGSSEKDTTYDQRNGVRCIRISPNGKHLASGDRAGNIRVHELQFMDELCKIDAHDAEVLCLEYSIPPSGSYSANYLASASRDRLIHLFNAGRNYSFLSTLDDHSSSITAVRFLPSQGTEGLQMVSCGADKSIIFRDVNTEDSSDISLNRVNHIVGKTTLYDMELDRSGKHILTACQDRNIRVYSVAGAKQTKTFKGSASEDGTLIKVVLDRSGIYCATSCTDKTLAIYDYHTGELMATMAGHSELVTGLAFSTDCKHLISVSGDSCIFVWRLPTDMVHTMQARLAATPNRNSSRTYIGSPQGEDLDNEEFGSPPPELLDPNANLPNDNDAYRFSVGKLPGWAKTKIIQSSASPGLQPPSDIVKGRWADRAGRYEDTPFSAPGEEDNSPKEGSSLEWARTGSSMSELGSMSPHPASQRTTSRPDTLDSFNDADVDEYSTQDDGGESTEPENAGNTMYFDQVEEPGDEYRVNAMDADELRRSQRKYRGSRPDLAVSDEEDEGGSSTPSADHSDKHINSMHCISMESVDQVGRRERFMQSNFESLSGGDETMTSLPMNTSSISNAWREGGAMQRNAGTIERARETRNAEQNKRREELQKRIEETRLKLQNDAPEGRSEKDSKIGYKSMKGSQSINDLSSFTEQQELYPGSGAGLVNTPPGTTQTLPRQRKAEEDGGGGRVRTGGDSKSAVKGGSKSEGGKQDVNLRRACSLSDLNKPAVARRILPSPPNNVSGKKSVSSRGAGGSGSETDRSLTTGRSAARDDRGTSREPAATASNSRLQERRRSVDDQRRNSLKSPMGDKPMSRLEQHERMLADRERERREGQRAAGLGHRSSSRSDLSRPKSVAGEVDDRDMPSYMRSTSASVKKEKAGGPPGPAERIRRKSSTVYSKSTNDLRGPSARDHEETSSEEEVKLRKRSTSQDRQERGPIRAKSERDLSRVAKVKLGSSGQSESGTSTPTQRQQRTKMKTTTLISNDGAVVVKQAEPMMSAKGTEAVDVTRAKLSKQLADRTSYKLQESADDLVKLYKRVSLDDDLDDQLRSQLLSQLAAGATSTLNTLKLVCDSSDSSVRPSTISFNRQPPQQDLASNPYFQHMLENYSNIMYQNMRPPPPPQDPTAAAGKGGKGGPSWC